MDKRNPQRQKRQAKGTEGNLWDCSVCTFSNTAEAFKCAMCDVRKGTSTRKPRLNPQLVAQQVAQAQHMTAAAAVAPPMPKPQPQQPPHQPQRKEKDETKERKQVQSTLHPEEQPRTSKKKIRNIRPRLKNVDRSQVHSQPVTVNNITVMITEYLPKAVSTSSQATTVTPAEESPVTNHSELPNGVHIPPTQSL